MPLYEYECSAHGVFELSRPMAESALGAACPECHAPAPRILSAVRLACQPAWRRGAHERNERSRHEPRIVERPPHAASREGPPPKARAVNAGGRPWAIGH
jgi:putative FmdB family regulatory protein